MNIYKINIPKSIIPLTILAVVFNILRIIIWGKYSFAYILWNVFLAFIPFIISSILLSLSKENKLSKTIFFIGFFLWIIFIPNAPYVVTDFIHLGVSRSVPILYDVMLLFSSASVALILGFHSLYHIEQIFRAKYSARKTSILIVIITLLISFGMYLGRFLRFNSWDIFVNHISLIKNIWKIISQSTGHLDVYFYTGLFFFFLYLSYTAWKYSNINKK
ncbi:MAG TPA: DUF1361 domain-containing protein [Candidatus Paceibacterota bacterium]|nr:DUF1361 domain-containing protein [Candidatus Paceibacterota bacterium]